MSHLTLTNPCVVEALADITTIYTDIDGTMLGDRSSLILGDDGAPNLDLMNALVRLHDAGIDVVPITGRGRTVLNEICRLCAFPRFSAELGAVDSPGMGLDVPISYHPGDMPYNQSCGLTPYQVIEQSGVIDNILHHFGDRIEKHPASAGREFSHIFMGRIDTQQVQPLLDEAGLELMMVDNGPIALTSPNLSVEKPWHVYHVLPRNCTKGAAVKRDMQRFNVARKQALAIGDACGDLTMGDQAGIFVLVGNGAQNPAVYHQATQSIEQLVVTQGARCAGWVEMANALLQARS